MVEMYTHGADGRDILLTAYLFVLLFGSKFPGLYNILDAHANSPPACRLHVTHGHTSF